VVFDAHGALGADSVGRVLARGGRHVTTLPVEEGFLRSLWRSATGGRKVIAAAPRDREEDYAVLGRLVAAGRIHPIVAEVFPLERAGEAFAAQEGGRAVGKVVIRVGEPTPTGLAAHLARARSAGAAGRSPGAAA
jgi:NADPH2:quinone reductase